MESSDIPSIPDIKRLLLSAICTAIEGGMAIREIYATDFAVEKKADESPLTLADQRSHKIIEKALLPFGIPILSEEGRKIPYEERAGWNPLWIVDPLDGTKEFVKRNGEFTVNIALVKDHRPVMGVIYVPVTDVLYYGETGLGAHKLAGAEAIISDGNDMEVIQSASVSLPIREDPCDPYTIVGSRSHATEALEQFVEEKRKEHGEVNFISAGSSLKICLVAEGSADIYPRLAPTMEWDTAAGQAIAEAAGAAMVVHETNEPLRYNRQELLNPRFVVKRYLAA